jgi:aminopeptidase N
MKKYLFFICFILLCSISFAQIPKSEQEIRKEMAEQRENFYRQEMLKEQQMTATGENYDVKYYSIDLTPDTATKTISSTVKIVGEVLASSLNSVDLDFAQQSYSFTDIHLSGLPDDQLTYIQKTNLITINLDSTFLQGEQFSIEITYQGSPEEGFYFDTHNSKALIQVLVNKPFHWWPCKNVLTDRADSADIRVTVPKEFVVVSSGLLKEVIIKGDTAIYWWHEQYPIKAGAIPLMIYPYEIHYDDYLYNDGADTMKIHFYNFPRNYDNCRSLYDQVKDMIAFFVDRYGEYPFVWEKFSLASFKAGVIKADGFAQQTHISVAIYTAWCIAHELSHQWWGNLIACKSAHHVWLSEGFAVYSEALWYEHAKYPGDVSTAGEYLMVWCKYLGSGTIYAESGIFNVNLVYYKASWVLHMLRGIVGDDVFFEILRTYCASPEYRYSYATTEDFQGICEQVSGINLEKFFHQWIYEEYYPFYEYNWNHTPDNNGHKVTLNVEQVQQERVSESAPLFWMPIDIKITMENSDTTFVI